MKEHNALLACSARGQEAIPAPPVVFVTRLSPCELLCCHAIVERHLKQ